MQFNLIYFLKSSNLPIFKQKKNSIHLDNIGSRAAIILCHRIQCQDLGVDSTIAMQCLTEEEIPPSLKF